MNILVHSRTKQHRLSTRLNPTIIQIKYHDILRPDLDQLIHHRRLRLLVHHRRNRHPSLVLQRTDRRRPPPRRHFPCLAQQLPLDVVLADDELGGRDDTCDTCGYSVDEGGEVRVSEGFGVRGGGGYEDGFGLEEGGYWVKACCAHRLAGLDEINW